MPDSRVATRLPRRKSQMRIVFICADAHGNTGAIATDACVTEQSCKLRGYNVAQFDVYARMVFDAGACLLSSKARSRALWQQWFRVARRAGRQNPGTEARIRERFRKPEVSRRCPDMAGLQQ
jgi:hypothetical protein